MADWAGRIERGLVRITTVARLEVGFSARTAADARSVLATSELAGLTVLHLDRDYELTAAPTGQAFERLRV